MTLHLHYHPLSSFCWKVLVALYEAETAFEPHILDLGDEAARAAFFKLWPIGKMPVLRDEALGATVPESSVIIDYIDQYYPGATRFVPADADVAWRVRLSAQVFDHYVHQPMQRIVGDRLRPEGSRDAFGVEQTRAQLATAYAYVETQIGSGWAVGDTFTLADCAAAPALFYADKVAPLGDGFPKTTAYLERLKQRPSFARVLDEAQPYFAMFPG